MSKKEDPRREVKIIWQDLSSALTIGWTLALPIVGGALAGYFLDKWFGTKYIFTIGLMVFGIMSGFYNLFKVIRKYDQPDKDEEDNAKGDLK